MSHFMLTLRKVAEQGDENEIVGHRSELEQQKLDRVEGHQDEALKRLRTVIKEMIANMLERAALQYRDFMYSILS